MRFSFQLEHSRCNRQIDRHTDQSDLGCDNEKENICSEHREQKKNATYV